MSEAEVQEKKLNEDTELRIVVNEGEAIVELVDGRAEIFGSELVKNKKYLFQKGNFIIATGAVVYTGMKVFLWCIFQVLESLFSHMKVLQSTSLAVGFTRTLLMRHLWFVIRYICTHYNVIGQVIYLNTHAALEQIRKVAECDPSHRGPRIMLVGMKQNILSSFKYSSQVRLMWGRVRCVGFSVIIQFVWVGVLS